MVRPPCCEKQNVTKGKWTEEEDTKLLACVSKHGTGNWTVVPKKAGLKRCGKSCRLRWSNYLKPDIRHESFTPQEEELVVKLHAAIGSRWSIIAQQLPGRTDNDVKNYWNTKLKKKLQGMGIDPVTHRPFSQIIADYGSIRDLTISGNQNGSLNSNSSNRDILKNTFMSLKSKAPTSEFPNIDTHMMTSVLSSTPKPEPIMYHDINNTRNNNSADLLSQLQAIQLVTEATNWAKYPETHNSFFSTHNNTSLFHEKAGSLPLISPSSSSSSTCSTAGQARSPLAFSWRDFLLDDDMLPAAAFQERQQLQDHEDMMEFPSNELHFQTMDVMVPEIGTIDNEGIRATEYGDSNNHGIHVSSSTDTFVEAMLDREDEMFLEFPDLLEEPYYN